MARKISNTKASDGPVEVPIALVLESAEILKCNVERRLPRFKAPRGKLESELNLNVHMAEGNGKTGIVGLLSVVLNGKSGANTEDGVDPFSIAFEIEGFYRLKDAHSKVNEEDLTRTLAMRIARELYPLAMMRSSELLSMIGYGGVRLSYGLETD